MKKTNQEKKVSNLKELKTNVLINPASIEDIEWIAKLEAELFNGVDVIPEELLKEWYTANPTGFFIIKNKNGERIGHADILPLRPETLKSFLEGKIIERQISKDDLFTPGEKDLIKNLYIECVSIPVAGRIKAIALVTFLSSLAELMSNICPVENLENIYAIAATKQGSQLMENFGFSILQEGNNRQDAHTLFVAEANTFLKNLDNLK